MRGSPPHTRGQLPLPWDSMEQQRITPAYAGTTKGADEGSETRRDHPRIRGDNLADWYIQPH